MTTNREDLKAFVDGELSSRESEQIREQLEKDPALAQDVTFLKLIGEGVRECAVQIPVVGVQEALEQSRKRWKRSSVLEIFGGLAAAALIAAVFFPVYAQWKQSAPGPLSRTVLTMERATSPKPKVAGQTRSDDTAIFVSPTADATVTAAPAAAAKTVASPSSMGGESTVTSAKSSINGLARQSPAPGAAANPDYQSPAPPVVAPGDANRMVVQNADLEEVVKDVSSAQNNAMNYVKSVGGFIASSSLNSSDQDNPQALMTARVPARSFSMAMNYFKGLAVDAAHIKSVNVTGQDVTAQYADTSARLRVMQAEQDSYITMLKSAKTLGQILALKDRLSNVREQIESLKSQSESLKNESDLSTINLTLEQAPKPVAKPTPVAHHPSWVSETWSTAVGGLHDVLKFVATLLIFLFVYSPVWAPLGLMGVWIYRRVR